MRMTQRSSTRKIFFFGAHFLVALWVGCTGWGAGAQAVAAPGVSGAAGGVVAASGAAAAVADPTMGIEFEVVSIRPTTPGYSMVTN